MKRFLVLILRFFIPLFALLACLECLVRKAPNEYEYKASWMNQHAGEVETLVLGSSHGFYGINPKYLDGCAFSLCFSAENLQYDLFLLKNWEKELTSLNQVILPISYQTMYRGEMENESDWWRVINYKVYMDCPYHSFFSKYSFFISNPTAFREKFYKVLSGKSTPNCDSLGFGWPIRHTEPPHLDAVSVASRVKWHTVTDTSNLKRNKELLSEIASICERHHARLILVTTPTYKTYYERLNTTQLQNMYKAIEETGAKSPVVFYLNHIADDRFVPADFSDSDHLSYDGATKFTKILNSEIDQR